jgi:flagellar protein FlbD
VILLSRLNGVQFALNPDLIERAEATPDTVVTLVDGTKYVVSESLLELMELTRNYRASVVATAHDFFTGPAEDAPVAPPVRSARVVSINRREQ